MSNFFKVIIFILPFSLNAQTEPTFADKIEECYSQEKFKDIKYRINHEKECFINLKFPEFKEFDMAGNLISNSDFKDKVVIINFWFTACPPCVKEIPHFNEIYKKYDKNKVLFLAPSTDDVETINEFIKQYGAISPTVMPYCEDLFRKNLKSRSGFPTTIVLDKKGIIKEYFHGGIKHTSDLEDIINRLLKTE